MLVTTLTKKMAEDLTDYLLEQGVQVRYLHSEVDTLRRVELLRELRQGVFDVLVGINLLREGLDLPEVSLVSILDADKEGFLRSGTSLIQTIGRAARNVSGQVHMYADTITPSMATAIDETNRRRAKQVAYNTANGVDPTPLRKQIADITDLLHREDADTEQLCSAAAAASSRAARPRCRAWSSRRRRASRRSWPTAAGRRPGRPDPAAHRPDARGRHRAAVRAGGPAARRDRRPQEGAAWHAAGGARMRPAEPMKDSDGMKHGELLAYCLTKPGAWQDEPWEGDVVAKVGEKIFAFLGAGGVGVKCGANRDEADEWLRQYPDDAHVMAYIGRYGWNSLNVGGAISDDEIREAVDASYADVVARLPKAQRPGVDR